MDHSRSRKPRRIVFPRFAGTLGGTFSVARDINNKGQVVRYELTAEGNRGVVYRSGKLRTLGTLAGADTYPSSINNCGEVVGEGVTAAGPHAFLHFKGEFVDLNSVLPMPVARHVVLESASAINDRGQVAATGFDSKKGKWRSYLLTPPASSRCGHRRGNTEITEHCPCAMNR